jgi:hypothetical protein
LEDINSRCKELIGKLQDKNLTVLDLVQLLDKAYELNMEAHERTGATEFLSLSRPASRTGSQVSLQEAFGVSGSAPQEAELLTSVRPASRAGSQVDLTKTNGTPAPSKPMVPNEGDFNKEKVAPKPHETYYGSDEGFQFSVAQNPERLVITWPRAWGDDFLRASVQNAQNLRDIDQDPAMVDYMVRHSLLSRFIYIHQRICFSIDFWSCGLPSQPRRQSL